MKFHPSDWRVDQGLRVCSLAARGLWIECMCIMHEATPYGHLLLNGRPVTDTQLSALTGAPPHQIADLLAELEAAGVFSRAANAVIYSRRMTRDEKKARTAVKNGKSGGNPSLGKQRDISPSDKGAVKGCLNDGDKPKSSESRVQKESPLPPNPPGSVDRVRRLVWTMTGRSEAWITAKLVSTDVEGAHQVRGWFDLGLSEERVLSEVERILTAARETGNRIGRPWSYLDAALRSLGSDGSAMGGASSGDAIKPDPWEMRMSSFRASGFWIDPWGPKPGEAGCLVPADVLGRHGFGRGA